MAIVSLPPMKRFLKITVRHRDQWHGPSEAGESRERWRRTEWCETGMIISKGIVLQNIVYYWIHLGSFIISCGRAMKICAKIARLWRNSAFHFQNDENVIWQQDSSPAFLFFLLSMDVLRSIWSLIFINCWLNRIDFAFFKCYQSTSSC